MTNPSSEGKTVQTECSTRRQQENFDEHEVEHLLDSISKLKRQNTHNSESYTEISKVQHRSAWYQTSVIFLTTIFAVLLICSTLVVCGSLPYVNPRTRKIDAVSESLEAEAILALLVLMFLWFCFAFALHLVCKSSRLSVGKNGCSSLTEP